MFETVLAVKAAAQAHSSFITNVIVPKFVRVRRRCYIYIILEVRKQFNPTGK